MKILTPLLICLFLFGQLSAQTVFNNTYSCRYTTGEQFTPTGKIIQTSDSGYVVAGTTVSGFPTLIKLNQNGDTLWTRKGIQLTPFNAIDLTSMTETLDKGLLLNYSGSLSSILTKTDSAGNVMWSKTFGTLGIRIYLGNIVTKADSSFIAVASYDSIVQTTSVINISSTGIIQGIKVMNYANQIAPTSDGGYIIQGFNGNNCSLTKLDANENITWSKVYTESDPDAFFRLGFVSETNGGGFIFGGGIFSNGDNIYLMKTDSVGNQTWSYNYSLPDFTARDGCVNPDGGATIFYSNAANSVGKSFMVDSTGTVTWTRQYVQNIDFAASAPTIDGGYIACFFGTDAIRVIKTNSLGATSCNDAPATQSRNGLFWSTATGSTATTLRTCTTTVVNEAFTGRVVVSNDACAITGIINPKENTGIQLYPNPASESFTIELDAQFQFAGARFLMFDCLGNKVREENITQQKTTISKNNLAPGIYFWQILNEAESLGSGKIIVQE